MLKVFGKAVYLTSRIFRVIAGSALTFLMGLTVLDVIMRMFGKPVVGTYELVAFTGAVVIGFAMPITSWMRGHIYVDFLTGAFPVRIRNSFNVVTRLMGIVFFVLAGLNLFKVAMDLKRNGEVSLTLRLPFYPVAIGVGISCFVLCFVLLWDIFKIFRGEYE
ncbi:MAG TPA: TRAP transporter small permease [bacterium]|jgi:TRAP-type C4-dicarboxylate transport system permease small subunit|nr:TRAP transporter small permease [bacterium]